MTMPEDPFADAGYRAAIVDLLGLLASGELSAFSRLASDADMAPSMAHKVRFAELAIREFDHYGLLARRLRELGADPEAAMQPFQEFFDAFHTRTRPSTWLEGLVKAYVGDGIATDFYREVAAYVDKGTAALMDQALADGDRADVIVTITKEAMRADRVVSGRLALWGRRLLGEALSQAQIVAVERDSLTRLLAGEFGGPGADLAEMGRMFTRLTEQHTRRMERLGLAA